MELCLLNFFIFNDELRNSCDFNSSMLNKGPGIYEVVRIIDSKPIFLEDHLHRFFKSANLANIIIDYSSAEIKHRIKSLIETNKIHLGNIRFQYNNHPDLGHLFLAWATPYQYPTKEQLVNGINIISINAMRENPKSKSTNLPVRELAEKLINKQQIEEVLLVNDNALITEGSRSNIFFIDKNKIYTPPADLVLEGVTRTKIINLAKQNNMTIFEKNIYLNEIEKFEACFLSSTSKSILPINQIDNIKYKISDVYMHEISVLYKGLIDLYIKNFIW